MLEADFFNEIKLGLILFWTPLTFIVWNKTVYIFYEANSYKLTRTNSYDFC